MSIEDFNDRIAARDGPVVVLNDEAHHTHDEESEWNKTIRALHVAARKGVVAQLDFTATPRHSKGQLFSWTVYDYPLKQAIIDGVVKRPLKGIAQGIGTSDRILRARVIKPTWPQAWSAGKSIGRSSTRSGRGRFSSS